MIDRGTIGRVAARWTTELVVVFVGVYAAFVVAEWDEERERARRAEQVREAIAEEVRSVQRNTHRVATNLPVVVGRMDSLMAAGQPFPLRPRMEAIGFRTHVWEASLASGALALLDVETFYLASLFYNELNAGFEQIEQVRDLSETILLPVAGAPAATFFEPDPEQPGTLRMRPQYDWYLWGTRRIGRLAHCITVLGDSLLVALEAPLDSTLAPLDPQEC